MAEEVEFFKEEVRSVYAKPHEIEALVEASQQTRAKHYMPAHIYLGAEQGTSKQEVLDLRTSHIDFSVQGTGTIYFHRRKNNTDRTQLIMPRTKAALEHWLDYRKWYQRRKHIEHVNSNLVFCRHDGTAIERFDSAWNSVKKIAGIEDLHYHDLRTSYGTYLIMAGASLKIVQSLIGHKDLRSTERYTHIERLMELRPFQAALAAMYENPNTFQTVEKHYREL